MASLFARVVLDSWLCGKKVMRLTLSMQTFEGIIANVRVGHCKRLRWPQRIWSLFLSCTRGGLRHVLMLKNHYIGDLMAG